MCIVCTHCSLDWNSSESPYIVILVVTVHCESLSSEKISFRWTGVQITDTVFIFYLFSFYTHNCSSSSRVFPQWTNNFSLTYSLHLNIILRSIIVNTGKSHIALLFRPYLQFCTVYGFLCWYILKLFDSGAACYTGIYIIRGFTVVPTRQLLIIMFFSMVRICAVSGNFRPAPGLFCGPDNG